MNITAASGVSVSEDPAMKEFLKTMSWTLFWTIIAQVGIGCILLAIPVAFFVYMVGLQFYKIRPTGRISDALGTTPPPRIPNAIRFPRS